MAHVKRKSDGRLFNVISGRILTPEDVVESGFTASFLILESDDDLKEKTMTMYAPLGVCDFELVDATPGFEVNLAKEAFIVAAEAEIAPLISEAQDKAVAEQQGRLSTGDNILDITPILVENRYNQAMNIIDEKNRQEILENKKDDLH